MLLRNGDNLFEGVLTFVDSSENLSIFVPYIKIPSLESVLRSSSVCKAIVVRWDAKDLILGSSDLEVYQYCKANNITLYRNARLHLKAYLDNYKRCLMGSSNISARGLNIPNSHQYNYELATLIPCLGIEDRLYFATIMQNSILITDTIYDQLKNLLSEKEEYFPNEPEFEIEIESSAKDLLTSSLPMSASISAFLSVYHSFEEKTEVEINCALHDMALYNLPLGLSSEDVLLTLRSSFFKHPFIMGFLSKLDLNRGIYFGAAKEWIHKNCTNVPTPKKWEITENIQILFRWIVELSDGEYAVDRPNFSERLYKV